MAALRGLIKGDAGECKRSCGAAGKGRAFTESIKLIITVLTITTWNPRHHYDDVKSEDDKKKAK